MVFVLIDQVLTLVAAKLNGHLSSRYGATDDIAVVTPITDGDGKIADNARNRLALFVTNISEDAMPRKGSSRGVSALGQVVVAAPLHLDVFVMLAAVYDPKTYTEGLKVLSAALTYFQTFPVMTPQNTPNLPRQVKQLTIEISNLRMEEVSQMWGNLGGSYVPSVMFKIRTVSLTSDAVIKIDPTIHEPVASATPKEEPAS
ncbi:DUF4255 domain-containing protein [Yoonia sediminilitoris]|nr:DUF4255 domain-containing protein [Yoonia sediminilitoris]